MKKTVKFLTMGMLFIGMTLTTGCKKEVVGPQGPQGPAGPSAKTYTFYVPLNAFSLVSSNNSYEAPASSYAPLGMSIGQYDDVSVYVYQTDGWYALPYTRYFNTGTAFNHFYYQLTDWQTLWVMIRNSTGGQPYTSMTTGSIQYRVVIISGQQGMKPQRPDDVDFSNYSEVKAYYNLLD